MGAYARAVKIGETETAVTYRCGLTYEANDCTFTIPKIPKEELLKKNAKELGLDFSGIFVIMKILRYYEKNGTYPDAISHQS